MRLLVFDVGGTEIKYAVMDEDTNVFDRGYVPTPMDSWQSFEDTIYGIYEKYQEDVEGIAMSLPGFIDVKKGRVNGGGALAYNHGTDVGPKLMKRCGCKVVLENDGKAAAQAEYYKGALQGCENAAVFVIGTGVGGGLIINHEIVRGPHFTAGEFSFVNTNSDSIDDFGSHVGMNCSTTGLLGMYKDISGFEEAIDGREFFRRLPEDEVAQRVLKKFCHNVAVQIYNLYFLLDIQKIAIGGGISRQPILTETIKEQFVKITTEEGALGKFMPKYDIEIVQCQFHNDANLIGAFMTYVNN